MKQELSKKIKSVFMSAGIEDSNEAQMTLLLIGSEKISLTQGAKNLNITTDQLISVLNQFNIHFASI